MRGCFRCVCAPAATVPVVIMFIESFQVESPNVEYSEDAIHSVYDYQTTELLHEKRDGKYGWIVRPKVVKYELQTSRKVPKLGCGNSVPTRGVCACSFDCLLRLCVIGNWAKLKMWLVPVWVCVLDVQSDAGWLGWQQRDDPDWRHHRQPGVSCCCLCMLLLRWMRLVPTANGPPVCSSSCADGPGCGRGISWVTKDGVQQANFFGSLTQASTCRIGAFNGEEIYAPFKSLLPMVQSWPSVLPCFFPTSDGAVSMPRQWLRIFFSRLPGRAHRHCAGRVGYQQHEHG